MTRAHLLYHLVRTGIEGDIEQFKKTALAIASEKQSQRQVSVANELTRIVAEYAPKTTVTPITHAVKQSALAQECLPQLNTDDLILNDGIVESCQELIEEQVKQELLKQHNLKPRHKIILCGPPGNGKTSLAEALAGELAVPLIKVDYALLINKFLGDSAKSLNMLFEQANNRRCVLFFDEFDSLAKERDDMNDVGEMKRLVNALLINIEALHPNTILIAATNHPQLLDSAIWRRFDLRLTLNNPDESQMKAWLTKFSERVNYNWQPHQNLILSEMSGVNFAELESVVLSAWRKFVLGDKKGDMSVILDKVLTRWKDNHIG